MQLWSLQDLAQRFIPSIFAVVGKKNTPTIHLCNNHRVKHVLVTKVFYTEQYHLLSESEHFALHEAGYDQTNEPQTYKSSQLHPKSN